MKVLASFVASAMAAWSDNFEKLDDETKFSQFESCKEAVQSVILSNDIENGGFNCEHLNDPEPHHTISCSASCDGSNYEPNWKSSQFLVQCKANPEIKRKFKGKQSCSLKPVDLCETFYATDLFPMGDFVIERFSKRGAHKLARLSLQCHDFDKSAKATCMSNKGVLKSKEDLETFCVPEPEYCIPPLVIEGSWEFIKKRKNGDKVFELHCPNTDNDMRGKVICEKSTGAFRNSHHSADEFLNFCVAEGPSGDGSGESSGEGSGEF